MKRFRFKLVLTQRPKQYDISEANYIIVTKVMRAWGLQTL